MDFCDVLIVGGGPAGSSCAWRLSQSGLDVVVVDKARFPRDKVCGGWITPEVVQALSIDTHEYALNRTLQLITGFRTSVIGDAPVETRYGRTVSYGVRRCEFDDFLLRRSGARVLEEWPLTSLERTAGGWVACGSIRCRVVVGAGGHFCPVARLMGARFGSEPIVAAQEIEFRLEEDGEPQCRARGEVPELYFCRDLKGYGWIFRKGAYLNVGLGRMDKCRLSRHVSDFLRWVTTARGLPAPAERLSGHAYLLYGYSPRNIVDDGVMLVGDAAGLAYPQSGEGIRPAVESGLLAAEAILDARGNYARGRLAEYPRRLSDRMGGEPGRGLRLGGLVPERMLSEAAALLMRTRWFPRRVVLDRWFLRSA